MCQLPVTLKESMTARRENGAEWHQFESAAFQGERALE